MGLITRHCLQKFYQTQKPNIRILKILPVQNRIICIRFVHHLKNENCVKQRVKIRERMFWRQSCVKMKSIDNLFGIILIKWHHFIFAYLFYASMQISNHWHFVSSNNRSKQRERIYMAEYTADELEHHLSIRSPDKRIPEKYWYQRYRLFSKYDDGIKLDIESWHSVTPQQIAMDIAQKCECNVIVDAMCGVGGNSIAFAQFCDFVISVDIDAKKIKMAQHNAKIYGVDDKIQFIVGDFFKIAQMFKHSQLIDVIFLSPPWGGQFYQMSMFDIKCLSNDGSMDGCKLFKICRQITKNIAYFLPKNTSYRQLKSLADKGEKCKIDKNRLHKKVKSITAYYGNLANTKK